jgi:hypothetical protein
MLAIDLYNVFLGGWDEGEMPTILEDYGLFDREESNEVWDRLEAGEQLWPWWRLRLQRAYREKHGGLGGLH